MNLFIKTATKDTQTRQDHVHEREKPADFDRMGLSKHGKTSKTTQPKYVIFAQGNTETGARFVV